MPTVNLFGNLRKIAGVKEISVPGTNGCELLRSLIERYPELEEYVFQGNDLRDYLVITINGHIVTDLNTQVTEQDQIAIFPPLGGGQILEQA